MYSFETLDDQLSAAMEDHVELRRIALRWSSEGHHNWIDTWFSMNPDLAKAIGWCFAFPKAERRALANSLSASPAHT
jgi:hypothetical protein